MLVRFLFLSDVPIVVLVPAFQLNLAGAMPCPRLVEAAGLSILGMLDDIAPEGLPCFGAGADTRRRLWFEP